MKLVSILVCGGLALEVDWSVKGRLGALNPHSSRTIGGTYYVNELSEMAVCTFKRAQRTFLSLDISG